jgi:hypothetical protein
VHLALHDRARAGDALLEPGEAASSRYGHSTVNCT